MLEQVYTLPGAQRESSVVDRNGKLRLCESGADVRGHVVGTFSRMPIQVRVFRDKAREEIGQVGNHVRIGVLLNHQRRRSVLAENRQQTGFRLLAVKPSVDLAGEFIQPLTVSRDMDLMSVLLHSTVTL